MMGQVIGYIDFFASSTFSHIDIPYRSKSMRQASAPALPATTAPGAVGRKTVSSGRSRSLCRPASTLSALNTSVCTRLMRARRSSILSATSSIFKTVVMGPRVRSPKFRVSTRRTTRALRITSGATLSLMLFPGRRFGLVETLFREDQNC
jgi:hypothetical protein